MVAAVGMCTLGIFGGGGDVTINPMVSEVSNIFNFNSTIQEHLVRKDIVVNCRLVQTVHLDVKQIATRGVIKVITG